jgi:hypothetical protein
MPIFAREGQQFLIMVPELVCSTEGQARAAAARFEALGLTELFECAFTGEIAVFGGQRPPPPGPYVPGRMGDYTVIALEGPLRDRWIAQHFAAQTG